MNLSSISKFIYITTNGNNQPQTNSVTIGDKAECFPGSVSIGAQAAIAGSGTTNSVFVGFNTCTQNSINLQNVVCLGISACADFHNEVVVASGSGISDSNNKSSLLTQWAQTTNATPVELGVYTGTNFGAFGAPNTYIQIPAPTTAAGYFFDVRVVGVSGANVYIMNSKFAGSITSTGASSFQISSQQIDTNTIGTVTWSAAITADTTNGGPKIMVTGAASTTIEWTATILMTKAAY